MKQTNDDLNKTCKAFPSRTFSSFTSFMPRTSVFVLLSQWQRGRTLNILNHNELSQQFRSKNLLTKKGSRQLKSLDSIPVKNIKKNASPTHILLQSVSALVCWYFIGRSLVVARNDIGTWNYQEIVSKHIRKQTLGEKCGSKHSIIQNIKEKSKERKKDLRKQKGKIKKKEKKK